MLNNLFSLARRRPEQPANKVSSEQGKLCKESLVRGLPVQSQEVKVAPTGPAPIPQRKGIQLHSGPLDDFRKDLQHELPVPAQESPFTVNQILQRIKTLLQPNNTLERQVG